MTRQFAINLCDGRVVLCTRETLQNVDYAAISEKVALAVEDGVISRQEVMAKIAGQRQSSSQGWDAILEKQATKNMRKSPITVEEAEKSETSVTKAEVKDEFDMEVPDGDKPKAAKRVVMKASVKEDLGEELKGL